MSATSSIQLHAFCDAHWARCKDTTKNIVIRDNIITTTQKSSLIASHISALIVVTNVRNKKLISALIKQKSSLIFRC